MNSIFRATVMLCVVGFVLLSTAPTGYARPGANNQALLEAAERLNWENLQTLDYGVYGKYRGTVVFMAHEDDVKSDDRFYWTMVQVLSEKFGCFMKGREKGNQLYKFRCRDGRRIEIRHGKSGDTRYFSARQYNRRGQQIILAASN